MAFAFLRKESLGVKFLGGSVFGSVLLHWLPTLFSFFLDFNPASHITAALVCGIVVTAVVLKTKPVPCAAVLKDELRSIRPSATLFVTIPVFVLFAILVTGSFEFRDGSVWSGQATFGDTCMHLGFITSIAEQGSFPPDYSILPGTKLAYPFLSDSISSSLYIFGAGLRFSYCLPMYFAGLQVMAGLWVFLREWLQDRSKTLLAWVLFILCGGFGFVYFLSGLSEDPGNFTRIFTAFYETPTNLVDENIRWVNVIVDMLLPQRATLFGWAVLMPTLYFLYKAAWKKERTYFILIGVLAGALPMIHTHSFVALAFVSAAWLLMYLLKGPKSSNVSFGVKLAFAFSLVFMQLVQMICRERESSIYLIFLGIYAAVFIFFLVVALIKFSGKDKFKDLISGWGLYLAVTLILAMPQLFLWTFQQASGENFIRGYFNWANIDDNYIWFYVKNIGLTFLMFIPGLLAASKKNTSVVFPVLIIWVVAELAVFQPNVYDNNKLLYVAFVFMCGISANYMVDIYRRIKAVPGSKILAVCAIVVCTVSAVLTLGREFIAEYELIGDTQYRAAQYISEHAEPNDTILTDQRHNNAVATLTGRNIVCGSPSYLYFHGLDYTAAAADQQKMYEYPRECMQLFEAYSVDYILISSYERSSYNVDEASIMKLFPCVYTAGDVAIYAVN